MTKDEFKLIILKQIRDVNSAFNTFMLNDCPNVGTLHYKTCGYFAAGEFDIRFIVESKNDDGVFQVFFDEGEELTKVYPNADWIDISDPYTLEHVYAMEEIRYSNQVIQFSLHRFNLAKKNYVFSKNSLNERGMAILVYDMRMKRFKGGYQSRSHFLEQCSLSRANLNETYSDYVVTQHDISAIDIAEHSGFISREDANAFREVYQTSNKSFSSSSMMSVVKKIIRI